MDIVKILAGYLVREAPVSIARAKGGDLLQQLDSLPNLKAWEELNEEENRSDEELKQAGEYFHEGGSVFMDYKILRDSVVPEGGMRKVVSRFRDDMTKDELRKTAEALVSEWLSSTGKERKP